MEHMTVDIKEEAGSPVSIYAHKHQHVTTFLSKAVILKMVHL